MSRRVVLVRLLVTTAFILVASPAPAFAQRQQEGAMPDVSPLGTSTPQPGRNGRMPPASQDTPNAQGPVSTIKAAARLVVVDVVVTDNKQAPVHGLKAADFKVKEDGAQQLITSFEEHVAPAQSVRPTMPRLPPGLFTNYTPVAPGSAVNILLLDALNTPMKDQMYVRDQLLEFLKKPPPGTSIAIFGLNDRLIMLQGFTSDLAVLKEVVEKVRPSESLLLADSVGNGGTAPVSEMMGDSAGGAADIQQLLTSVQQYEASQAATDSQTRARATLDAMNQLANFMAGIPGRKNLIWFSGSFPLDVFPQGGIAHPFDVVENSEDEFRATTDLLTRSQVAIYSVDARGLQTGSSAVGTLPTITSMSRSGVFGTQDKTFQDNANEHMTMNRMAADTGGQAYVDANGLSAAVQKAIENGSNYYTLSYTPTNPNADGAFRKIQVKAAQKGVTLSYRSGYFADDAKARLAEDAKAKSKHGPTLADSGPVQPSSYVKAMLHGAPPATGIMMKLQVLPENDATEASVAKGNVVSTVYEAKGPFRRYVIDIAADARDLHITPTPDGRYQFLAEVVTYVYDASGAVVNTASQRSRGNLSVAAYANMGRVGLPFHQEVSVPVNGEYYLRTAIHDLETDHFGAVEIPVASVAKLAPLMASSARAPSK